MECHNDTKLEGQRIQSWFTINERTPSILSNRRKRSKFCKRFSADFQPDWIKRFKLCITSQPVPQPYSVCNIIYEKR